MAVQPIVSSIPSRRRSTGLLLGLRARLAAPRLDGRLAAGDDPRSDTMLARRSAQLVSRRSRRRTATALERVCAERPGRPSFSAAIPVQARAVEIARPALAQLAAALRSQSPVDARGVALSQVLLTEGCSALYRPARPEELYETAREALLALREL